MSDPKKILRTPPSLKYVSGAPGQVTFFKVKNENLWVAVFRICVVWHVGWWNLITSVRLIQVGNNRNDHFRYFLGVRVRLIEVSAIKGFI